MFFSRIMLPFVIVGLSGAAKQRRVERIIFDIVNKVMSMAWRGCRRGVEVVAIRAMLGFSVADDGLAAHLNPHKISIVAGSSQTTLYREWI